MSTAACDPQRSGGGRREGSEWEGWEEGGEGEKGGRKVWVEIGESEKRKEEGRGDLVPCKMKGS